MDAVAVQKTKRRRFRLSTLTVPPARGDWNSLSPERKIPVPRTGEKCTVSGLYRSENCKNCSRPEQTDRMDAGDTFPPCTKCKYAINWTLIQRS